jgi:hypothetical protein
MERGANGRNTLFGGPVGGPLMMTGCQRKTWQDVKNCSMNLNNGIAKRLSLKKLGRGTLLLKNQQQAQYILIILSPPIHHLFHFTYPFQLHSTLELSFSSTSSIIYSVHIFLSISRQFVI